MAEGRPDGADAGPDTEATDGVDGMANADGSTDDDATNAGEPTATGGTADSAATAEVATGRGEQSGKAAFLEALRVRRNAALGAVVGVAFTAVVFALFVVLPGTYRSPLWYLGLAFVLAMSTAGFVAFLLTLGRAVRLSREL